MKNSRLECLSSEVEKTEENAAPTLRLVPDSPQKSNYFGANQPIDEEQANRTRSADAHRSPAAKRARQALAGKIQGARREQSRREESSRVSVPAYLVERHLPDWLADSDSVGQSPLTLEGKNVSIEKLVWFLGREEFRLCGRIEVDAFLEHVRKGHNEPDGRYGTRTARAYKPVGARTPHFHFVNIRTYFKWMVECNIIEVSPLDKVKAPEWRKPKVKPLTVDEINALLSAMNRMLNRSRNTAIIVLMFDTGLRISELCSLQTQNVDLVKRTITVIGKGDKERTVHFHTDVARILRAYIAERKRPANEALFYSERGGRFGDGLTPEGVRQMLKRLAKFANIDPKRVSPHKLRHSFATEWIKQNGSPKALQMLLGHEKMDMTYEYVELVEADTAQQHRQFSPAALLRGKKEGSRNRHS